MWKTYAGLDHQTQNQKKKKNLYGIFYKNAFHFWITFFDSARL